MTLSSSDYSYCFKEGAERAREGAPAGNTFGDNINLFDKAGAAEAREDGFRAAVAAGNTPGGCKDKK